jgi:hypothetical protein
VITRTTVDSVSFGNRQILEIMLDRGLLPGPATIRGWGLRAVWADWESSGTSSYRFFARKTIAGVPTVVPVPSSLLTLEFLDPYVRETLRLRGENVIGGTDLYKILSRLRLGDDTFAAEGDSSRQLGAGTTLGVFVGSGSNVLPPRETTAFYLPGRSQYIGYGVSDDGSDTLTVDLRLAPSRSVPASLFSAFLNLETAGNSRGPQPSPRLP